MAALTPRHPFVERSNDYAYYKEEHGGDRLDKASIGGNNAPLTQIYDKPTKREQRTTTNYYKSSGVDGCAGDHSKHVEASVRTFAVNAFVYYTFVFSIRKLIIGLSLAEGAQELLSVLFVLFFLLMVLFVLLRKLSLLQLQSPVAMSPID